MTDKIKRPKPETLDLRDLHQNDLVLVIRPEGKRLRVLYHMGTTPGRLATAFEKVVEQLSPLAEQLETWKELGKGAPSFPGTRMDDAADYPDAQWMKEQREKAPHNCSTCGRDPVGQAVCAGLGEGSIWPEEVTARQNWFFDHEAADDRCTTKDPCPGWFHYTARFIDAEFEEA